jgi:gamma-glutamyltranspeptidase/glutathione hydrolase
MTTAPHRAASEAGAEVLRAGGNAVEAMVAMAATIAVVYPHMTGIGGDAFALIAEPGRPPKAIDACGAAGSLATLARYERAGHDAVPARGPDAAITVAGAVSAWIRALEIAAAIGGRVPRRELLADAVRHAREGVAVSRSMAAMLAEDEGGLRGLPAFAAVFMPEGKPPEAGARLEQERLADALDRLAHAGLDDFYRGDVAAMLAADLEAAGSPVTRDDLRRHEARLVTPLSVRLAGVDVFNTPPPTQGIASLIILGLFERLGVKRGETFEHHHGLIEATKRAWLVRDREVADPAFAGEVAVFLEPVWLDAEAETIDRTRAAPWPLGERGGDTVWMGAIDASGVAVSFIQSLFWQFGSGVVSPGTGVLWHNRGFGFSLDPDSRNALAPGKKPFHTLNPPLARFDDGRTMVYGSMGGDGQPQFQSQIFTRHVRFGMEPGEAIAAPRWRFGRTGDDERVDVAMESRFDPDLVAALERAGHAVALLDERYSDSMGHAGMIVRRPDGRVIGASDPRSDGAAIGE